MSRVRLARGYEECSSNDDGERARWQLVGCKERDEDSGG